MKSKRSGQVRLFLFAMLAIAAFLLIAACNANQSEISARVDATLTEESVRQNAINTSVAASLQALPSATVAEAQATQPPATEEPSGQGAGVCPESMADLSFLTAGHLAGGRILVTLQKTSEFEAQSDEGVYTLRMRGSAYPCSILNDNRMRIYCSGRPVPPPGQTAVELVASDGSCTYDLPFDAIPIPPKPTEKPSGRY
jgi:hypothetical protein